jgi:hypothetical protein
LKAEEAVLAVGEGTMNVEKQDAKALPEASDARVSLNGQVISEATVANFLDESKTSSYSQGKLSRDQMAAALSAVSRTRGKPILRSRISFVGEGAAGKTSIIRALCTQADTDPASTIGIDRSCVEFDISAVNVEANGDQVRCWRRLLLFMFAVVYVFRFALALNFSAVDHEHVCRHPFQ